MRKLLFAILLLSAGGAAAQPANTVNQVPLCTVSNLPTCIGGPEAGRTAWVLDAANSTTCSAGGGTSSQMCVQRPDRTFTPADTGGAGGSQTPWLTDIDGNTKNLTNAGNITASGVVTATSFNAVGGNPADAGVLLNDVSGTPNAGPAGKIKLLSGAGALKAQRVGVLYTVPVAGEKDNAVSPLNFVPGDITIGTGTITVSAGHPYLEDQGPFQLTTSAGGTLVGGTSPALGYYIDVVTPTTFRLRTTPGGTTIPSFSSAGAGTHTLTAMATATQEYELLVWDDSTGKLIKKFALPIKATSTGGMVVPATVNAETFLAAQTSLIPTRGKTAQGYQMNNITTADGSPFQTSAVGRLNLVNRNVFPTIVGSIGSTAAVSAQQVRMLHSAAPHPVDSNAYLRMSGETVVISDAGIGTPLQDTGDKVCNSFNGQVCAWVQDMGIPTDAGAVTTTWVNCGATIAVNRAFRALCTTVQAP